MPIVTIACAVWGLLDERTVIEPKYDVRCTVEPRLHICMCFLIQQATTSKIDHYNFCAFLVFNKNILLGKQVTTEKQCEWTESKCMRCNK